MTGMLHRRVEDHARGPMICVRFCQPTCVPAHRAESALCIAWSVQVDYDVVTLSRQENQCLSDDCCEMVMIGGLVTCAPPGMLALSVLPRRAMCPSPSACQAFLQRVHQLARRSSGKRPSHRAWTWRAGRISCQ